MTRYEIIYKKKGEKEPYFTTYHEADNASEALEWANKQLTTEHDKDSVIEIAEEFI